MSISAVNEVLNYLDHSVVISDGTAVIKDEARLKATIHSLAEISALETGARQGAARYGAGQAQPATERAGPDVWTRPGKR